MSEGTRFEYSEILPAGEAAGQLERIAEALRHGFLKMEGRGNHIALAPQSPVRFELKAESKPEKGELRFDVSWTDAVAVASEKLQVLPTYPEPQGVQDHPAKPAEAAEDMRADRPPSVSQGRRTHRAALDSAGGSSIGEEPA